MLSPANAIHFIGSILKSTPTTPININIGNSIDAISCTFLFIVSSLLNVLLNTLP